MTAPGKAGAEHFVLSGTSMSAGVAPVTVALMLQKDPQLDNDTVKARLMRSAKKVDLGDPLATGAGVLDIEAALEQWGSVSQAPSPRVVRDTETGRLGFENTAVTWGRLSVVARSSVVRRVPWSDAYLWSDTTLVDADTKLIEDVVLKAIADARRTQGELGSQGSR